MTKDLEEVKKLRAEKLKRALKHYHFTVQRGNIIYCLRELSSVELRNRLENNYKPSPFGFDGFVIYSIERCKR